MSTKIRIGDLLVKEQVITSQQLDEVIAKQQQTGGKLGKLLIESGYIEEQQLLNLLAEQLNIAFVDLRYYEFNYELVRKLPEVYARRFRAMILQDTGNAYLIGMGDPLDIFAYDEITSYLKRHCELAIVREADLLHSIDLVYRRTEEINSFAEALSDELQDNRIDLDLVEAELGADEAPVVKLLQSLFEDAVQVGASDIHIEPDAHVLRIRLRVDGVLQEQEMKEKHIVSALTQRLKLMGKLNIAERRLPQDGRFNINVKGHNIDVRLSTMPIQFGESVVMRLLDQSTGVANLDKIGMPPDMLQRLRRTIHQPHGLLLVTGPTGSGKTTTLYAGLSELNQSDKKIITVEDPVEYRLPRINQVQVNQKIELDFARVLRAALRQDPDILMIGEIRDQETAAIALRAAITGHMVFATLHTNDAASSATRLIDMGAPGYLVASSLNAIIAQRLVRRICTACTEFYTPDPHERAWLDAMEDKSYQQIEFKRGKGCMHCNRTGYDGRVGVFELLVLDAAMIDALRRNSPADFAQAVNENKEWQPLRVNALDLAAKGETSLSEVVRVVT